ncbi:MAG TPA: hypothetical protein VFL46_03795 [Phycicoccus sp.]|nr:hypothetical protein [Phycicoccus sp.]
MSTATVQRWEVRSRRGWAGTSLLVVLLLVAANAVYGGIGLLVSGMGMPEEWLEPLPVDTWTLPGVALLLTVALPQLVAAWLVWTHHRWAALAGVLAGVGLVLWIGAQLLLLQRYFFLQPVIAGLGLAEVVFGWAWWRREGRPEPVRQAVRPTASR